MAGILAGLVPVYHSHLPPYHVPYPMRISAAAPRLYEIPSDGDDATRIARQTIDSDIDKLQAQIQGLRKRRNGLSVISVLPPELLAKIFIFVRDPSNPNCAPNTQAQWMRVSHVCYHWREVALSCPSLWSTPIFTNPDLAQEMLLRSKKAALTIEAPMAAWTPRLMNQLECALEQFNRIRTLKLHLGGNVERLQKLISFFADSAPVLETVSFATPPYYTHVPTITIPDEAFKQAYQLKNVDLDRVSISWKCGIFQHSSLTKLHLKNLKRAFFPSTTFTQMLDALENLPHLRCLELADSLPSHTTSDHRCRNIVLTELQQLHVISNVAECAAFLSQIQFPANTNIRLRCTATEEDLEVYVAILSKIGQLTQQSSSESTRPIFPSAVLSCSTSGGARVELYESMNARSAWPSPSDAHISIQFNWDYVTSAICNRVWGDMCTKLDFSQVQQLVVDRTPDDSNVIAETIGRFPKLHTLDLSDAGLMRVTRAIMEDWDKAPVLSETQEDRYSLRKRRKPEFVFPSVTLFTGLKTLKIIGADFSEQSVCVVDNMVDMLMQRCNANSPIERLELDSCMHLQDWKLKRFGEMVIDLYKDKRQIDITKLNGEWEESEWDEDEEDEDDYDYDDYDHYEDYGGFSDDDLGFLDLF